MSAPAVERCPHCGGLVIFATARAGRLPFDAVPMTCAVPLEAADLDQVPAYQRRVRLQRVYRPHAETCARPEAHQGRTARVAGERDQ